MGTTTVSHPNPPQNPPRNPPRYPPRNPPLPATATHPNPPCNLPRNPPRYPPLSATATHPETHPATHHRPPQINQERELPTWLEALGVRIFSNFGNNLASLVGFGSGAASIAKAWHNATPIYACRSYSVKSASTQEKGGFHEADQTERVEKESKERGASCVFWKMVYGKKFRKPFSVFFWRIFGSTTNHFCWLLFYSETNTHKWWKRFTKNVLCWNKWSLRSNIYSACITH